MKGGFKSWVSANKQTDSVHSVAATELEKAVNQNENTPVFDVRKPGEFEAEHLKIAQSTPLDFINKHLKDFPTNTDFYIHCAGGYRSMIAASILKSRGIHNLIDVQGGYKSLKETDLKTTNFVCPSTLKK